MPRLSRRTFAAASLAASMAPGLARAQQATPAEPASAVPDPVSDALDQLPAVVQDMMDRTGVPGVAVAVVANDQVVFAEGFGVRNIDTGAPVDADTVFQLASVSKPLGSTVIAGLVGEGAVGWDTKMADIDPEFALNDPWVTANVTIADLYSHRSGLPDHAGDTLEDLGGSREEVIHRLRYLEPDYPFRAGYAYTNFGLTAAAVAAAQHAGTTFEGLADSLLFGPLGMTSSSYRHSDFVSRENRADLHVQQDGAWVQAFERQPDAQSPAGGASSSARDMAQWLRLQLGHGMVDGTPVIGPEALGMTHVPHAISNPAEPPFDRSPGFYGLGWNVGYDASGTVTLGHSGAFALGASTAVYLRPGDGLGIVVLTNGFPMGVPEAIALEFLDLATIGTAQIDYLDIIGPIIEASVVPPYGDGVQDAPADPEPPLSPQAYLGIYDNDVFGDLVIKANGADLEMTLGPAGMTFPLTHHNREVFTYTPPGENGGAPSAVTFTIDADGVASRVVVENLDLYGAGTFTRA
jgi:CubicO group peptidase (beta-lactamase class C family)